MLLTVRAVVAGQKWCQALTGVSRFFLGLDKCRMVFCGDTKYNLATHVQLHLDARILAWMLS